MSALLAVLLLLSLAHGEAKSVPKPDEVRAVYLSIDSIRREAKIQELERILADTNANGIVIDYKDSAELPIAYMQKLVARFKRHGAYTIARIVVFQDSQFVKRHPEIALKKRSGEFWYSGRAVWKRYWLDPASQLAQDYNIEVAMRAIDAGFDEIQFDYIRFPTDGDMKDIQFPIFKEGVQTKGEVMNSFFKKISSRLNAYAPQVLLSIDIFGEVFLYGRERGIGQHIEHIATYFDVLAPMGHTPLIICVVNSACRIRLQSPIAYITRRFERE